MPAMRTALLFGFLVGFCAAVLALLFFVIFLLMKVHLRVQEMLTDYQGTHDREFTYLHGLCNRLRIDVQKLRHPPVASSTETPEQE